MFSWARLTTARGLGKGVSLWVNDTGKRFAFSCINQTNHVFLGEGAFRAAGRDGFAPYVVSMEDVTQYYSVAGVPTSISRIMNRCGIETCIAYTDTNVQHSGLALFEKFQKTNPNQDCVVEDYNHWGLYNGYNGDGHSVAYDSKGKYGICWYDPGNRTLLFNSYEVVDGSPGHPAGRYCSLAFDSHGYPHISYQDVSGRGALKYAFKNETGWYTYTIDSTVGAGQYTSIVIDANDEPHISYSTGSQLKYASLDGTTWYTQVVDNTPTMWTSIDVDSDNKPHIAYYDSRKDDLRFAWWEPYIRLHPFPR